MDRSKSVGETEQVLGDKFNKELNSSVTGKTKPVMSASDKKKLKSIELITEYIQSRK